MRALYLAAFEKDCEVHLASSGEQALADAPRFAPDVVLLSLPSPGMSGSFLPRAVRALPALEGVPVALIVCADDNTFESEPWVDDCFVKPLRPGELSVRVRSLVRLRRARAALEQRTRELEEGAVTLRETRDQLVRAERMVTLGSLAAGLAHEINNPLSYIKAGASQLLGSVDDLRSAAEAALTPSMSAAAMEVLQARIRETHGEATEVALALAEGSRRLERLAADLRVVTTPASGAPELVNPLDALDAAWTVIRSRFTSLPHYEVAAEPGVPLQSSHALVTQALLPILERAVVVAGPEGAVRVQLQQLPGGVENPAERYRPRDPEGGLCPDLRIRPSPRGEVPAGWAWRSPTASPMGWEATWQSRRLPGRAPPSASGCRAYREALFHGSCPASPAPR